MNQMIPVEEPPRSVVCVRNDDWPLDLQVGEVYRVLADPSAGRSGWIRVMDETGEDYLYPGKYFIAANDRARKRDQRTRRASRALRSRTLAQTQGCRYRSD